VRCRERKREIPASATRSLLCQGMLMNIVYVVNSESHFGSMRERVFSEVAGTFYWEMDGSL